MPETATAHASNPATAARAQWERLGAEGTTAGVYRDARPVAGVDPVRLRCLLTGLDAAGDPGLVLSACVQLATSLPLLAEAARPGGSAGEAAAAVVERMLRGTSMVALAATDEGPGSDLAALGTRVRRDGDRLELTGTKRWITNATHADHLLILARHRPGPHFTNFIWVLVPADISGVRIEPVDGGLFASAGVGHVRLDGVRLPEDAAVGGTGRGLPLFARHITVERLAGGLWATAWCHRALKTAREWLMSRGLWERDTIRHRYGVALVRARQLGALVETLAEPIARRHDAAAAALVKAAAGDTVDEVLGICAHLLGAQSFVRDGLQFQRAQAALFAIAGGSTEVVLANVADHADQLLRSLAPEAVTP